MGEVEKTEVSVDGIDEMDGEKMKMTCSGHASVLSVSGSCFLKSTARLLKGSDCHPLTSAAHRSLSASLQSLGSASRELQS